MEIKSKFFKNLSELPKQDYNDILKKDDSPFITFDFLDALEKSNSVGSFSGWESNHLGIFNKNKLSGFMPLYLKNNSHGEFIFDHQWSYALQRAGRDYYPKLLTAIPFTPCETRKCITEGLSNNDLINAGKDLMTEKNIETWHVLFPDTELQSDLKNNNFIERSGYRFEWNNKEYKDFEDFLNIFTSKQRKNIRAERKKISKLDITFDIKDKSNLSQEDWDIFYKFYVNTYAERMQAPYLNQEFFKLVHKSREVLNPVIFFAVRNDEIIAGSLCFEGSDTLFGRHWGASENIDSLHFECCFYQGIEYCIKNNIKFFDPGVQGEHKIRRGFEPRESSSFHFILQKDFREAIQKFCIEETESVKRYLVACQEYTPIKKIYRI